MKLRIALAVSVLALVSATTFAAETETLIESWETGLGHWVFEDFDGADLTTFEGMTNGTQALELDLKDGWQQGLKTTNYGSMPPDADQFVAPLVNAKKLRLDVTTSSGLINLPASSGLLLSLFIQGGSDGVYYVHGYTGVLVNAVYSASTVTETVEWDLTVDNAGTPVTTPVLPYTTTDRWFDMRIHTNVIGNGTNAQLIVVDNLRAVHGGVEIPRLGDFSGDNIVDQADYTTWADNFGSNAESVNAANSSLFMSGSYVASNPPPSLINQAMYTTWADNFGKTYASSVPEPATMSLLALGALAIIRKR